MAVVRVSDPAIDAVPVTPNDSVDLPDGIARSLIVATAGNLKLDMASGDTRTITVPAGVLPLQVKRVHATGTTASDITALY